MRRRIAATRRLHGLRTGRTPRAAYARDSEPGASARPASDTTQHTSAGDARALQAGPSSHHGADRADPDADADPATRDGEGTQSPCPHAPPRTPTGHDRVNGHSQAWSPSTRHRSPVRAHCVRRPSHDLGGWTREHRHWVAGLGPPCSRAHPDRHHAFVAAGAESHGSRGRIASPVVSVGPGVRRFRTPAAADDQRARHARRTRDPDERPGAATCASGLAVTGPTEPELGFRWRPDARCARRSDAPCSRRESVRRFPLPRLRSRHRHDLRRPHQGRATLPRSPLRHQDLAPRTRPLEPAAERQPPARCRRPGFLTPPPGRPTLRPSRLIRRRARDSRTVPRGPPAHRPAPPRRSLARPTLARGP